MAAVTVFADEEGMRVARQVAGYELGDPSWADLIVRAYLNPVQAAEELKAEMDS